MNPLPHLLEVEAHERVAVLFAAESGSRAWGFASPDSDWDVRFIYARPTLWHLNLTPGRDVIEQLLPGDVELAGWDMRKTLGLTLRGNCAVREWLCSPIIYRSEAPFADGLRELCRMAPGRNAARHHYLALIERVRSQWLRRDPVRLKKYLYAIRPALVLRWLRTHPAGTPPMDIAALLATVKLTQDELAALRQLLAMKAEASELGAGAPLPALDALIAEEVAHAMAVAEPPEQPRAEALAFAQHLMVETARYADRQLAKLGP
jgi:uncharacterized protein